MKTFTKSWQVIVIGAVIVLAFSLAACATTVPIESVRAPTIDTSGMQRLAIKDFENKSGNSLGAQLTNYLTSQAKQLIPATGYFTIVAAGDPNAEGVFTGEITVFAVNDRSEQAVRRVRNADGSYSNVPYTQYIREVSVAFSYSVVSSRTQMPVGTVNKSGKQSSSSTESSALTAPLTLAQRIVDSQLRTLQQDIVPTIVSTNRTLMKETSKDKAVKERMKIAQALVRNNNYEEAIRQYDEIADEYGSVAARANASILRESVASDIAARTRMAELYSNTDGRTERAVKNTIDALYSKLPSGANIMIIKTSSTERNMLDYVVDQITRTVVQAGKLRVIDRSNQALINAELEHQLSGYVSDDSIVSIGHQLGAQYIVLCWISGVKSTRRLNIRVLNVETAQITDQNDFEI